MRGISEIWMELFDNKKKADSRKKEMSRFFRCIYKENNEDEVTFFRIFYLPKKDIPFDEMNLKGLIENKENMAKVNLEEFNNPKDRANQRTVMRLDWKCLCEDYTEGSTRRFFMFYVPYHSASPAEKQRRR